MRLFKRWIGADIRDLMTETRSLQDQLSNTSVQLKAFEGRLSRVAEALEQATQASPGDPTDER